MKGSDHGIQCSGTSPSPNGRAILSDVPGGRLVICRTDELRPHPAYIRHHLAVDASQLSALAGRGELAFLDPIVITRDRTLVDGYARRKLAGLKGRQALLCMEYEWDEMEALQVLLQTHCRLAGFRAFTRISLALDLESFFKERARLNQQIGGQYKGSSNLTKAERVDVRSKIAAAAAVAAGNVDKVKHLIAKADPELLDALRAGEVSIHRAWCWSRAKGESQREALIRYRSERGLKRVARNLISHHRLQIAETVLDAGYLVRGLSGLNPMELASTCVAVIKVPGKRIFVTEELLQTFRSQEELAFTCSTNSP